MLVGPTGGGKTTNYNILKGSLSDLDNNGYYKVTTWIMNPKNTGTGIFLGNPLFYCFGHFFYFAIEDFFF